MTDAILIIDGETETTLASLLAANPDDIEPDDVMELQALEVGDVCEFGGGAFADMRVERIA